MVSVVKQISQILVTFMQALTQVINSLDFLQLERRNPICMPNPLPRRVLAFLGGIFPIPPISPKFQMLTIDAQLPGPGAKNSYHLGRSCPGSSPQIVINPLKFIIC